MMLWEGYVFLLSTCAVGALNFRQWKILKKNFWKGFDIFFFRKPTYIVTDRKHKYNQWCYEKRFVYALNKINPNQNEYSESADEHNIADSSLCMRIRVMRW